jgi:hypothetical protein
MVLPLSSLRKGKIGQLSASLRLICRSLKEILPKKGTLAMVTVKVTWIGFVALLLIMLLIVVAALYWQHVTGMNPLHSLAVGPLGGGAGQGC